MLRQRSAPRCRRPAHLSQRCLVLLLLLLQQLQLSQLTAAAGPPAPPSDSPSDEGLWPLSSFAAAQKPAQAQRYHYHTTLQAGTPFSTAAPEAPAPPDLGPPVVSPTTPPGNTTQAPPPPPSVAQVLQGLFTSYAGPVLKAAQNILSYGLMQAEHLAVTLPQCKQTNVLLNSGHFPARIWGNMTAEQQVLHPINAVMIQLAYMVYRPAADVSSCLTGMGADMSTLHNFTVPVSDFSTVKTAYVFRAGKERVFVLFRGSSETDVLINIACRQEQPANELFAISGGPQIKVHRGYWSAWQAMEGSILGAVQSLLKEVPSKEVYVVGHSLGAALGSVAALRMNAVLPRGVAGAWLFAAPRAGNAAWAAAYNKHLLHKTVRFSNYLDFAVRVPAESQSCSLGGMSLTAETGSFQYSHVGRSVLMCPEHDTGLTQFRVAPQGSEVLTCFGNDDVDATGATHVLGSYFDAWRRGHYKHTRHSLANDLRIQAVLCQGCTINTARFRMEQIRCPARAGGPVTCTVDAMCTSKFAHDMPLSVGNFTPPHVLSNLTTCSAYMCTHLGDVRQ